MKVRKWLKRREGMKRTDVRLMDEGGGREEQRVREGYRVHGEKGKKGSGKESGRREERRKDAGEELRRGSRRGRGGRSQEQRQGKRKR